VQREFEEFKKNSETSNITISMIENDLFHWKGTILGPEDTPYQGGKFIIDI